MWRDRHQEFIRFLNAVKKSPSAQPSTPSSTNTQPTCVPPRRSGLNGHPRFTVHLTPTSASWLNAVEGFFNTLTKCPLKRGVFLSVADHQAAINRFLNDHNANSKLFEWVAHPPSQQVAVVRRGQHRSRLGWVRAVTPTRVAAFGGYTANEPGRPARGGRPAPTPPCG
jgi:hypothetical protein